MKMKLDEIVVDTEMIFEEELILEVINSIRNFGLMTAIQVKQDFNGKYHLLAGQLRFIAVQRLGFQDVEVEIINTE